MPVGSIQRGPDFNAAITLLAALKLPVADLTPAHCENFFYFGAGNLPSGLVGLEIFGEVALLRSLAVAADAQGKGSGTRLLRHAEDFARAQGVAQVYLLTTTAGSFFSRQGYSAVSRSSAPEAIKATREFAGLCPASSAFMAKALK